MDEVLASLQRGQIKLRKVPAASTPSPTGDARSSLMSAIRQGVTLKKVRCWYVDRLAYCRTIASPHVSLGKNVMTVGYSPVGKKSQCGSVCVNPPPQKKPSKYQISVFTKELICMWKCYLTNAQFICVCVICDHRCLGKCDTSFIFTKNHRYFCYEPFAVDVDHIN